MRVEHSGTIDRPPGRGFGYVSAPNNDPKWVPASRRHEKLSPGPMRAGSITGEDVVFLGRQMRYAWEVTRDDPPTAFALRTISGPLPATIHLLLEPLEGGATRLTLAADMNLRGVYKLVGPLVRRVANRRFGTQLCRLKKLPENEARENAVS